MRNARKIALLAVVAVAALAMSAASASAVTVNVESTGVACSAITPPVSHGPGTGGCPLSAVSSGQVELGTALGMTLCNNQFEGRVNGNGEGYIYNHTITNCSPINVTPCTSPEGGTTRRNWPAELTTETNMEAVFCVVAFGITVNCHLPSITVTQNATHGGTYSTGASHQFCEGSATSSVQGTWNAVVDAAHPAVEPVG